jgi:hypothetical protein
MGTQCLVVQLGHPVSRGYKYGGLVLQVGVGRGVDSLTPKKSCCREVQGRPRPITGCHAKQKIYEGVEIVSLLPNGSASEFFYTNRNR